MTEEKWKMVDEFPTYSISSCGRLRNDITRHILIGGYDRDGYKQATICYAGKQYNRRICRLVAIAFIPNPNNLPMVNHKDENKENDCVDNLEWCTAEYNNNYGNKNQSMRKRVRCIETKREYDGLRVAEKQCGIPHSMISRACRFGITARGLHWEYVVGGNI